MDLKGNLGELNIRIIKRSNTDSRDYWDANWLEAEIKVNVLGFRALYGANLRIDDLQRFYENLLLFLDYKKNEIEFTTMEEGIYLKFTAEVNGEIKCEGIAKNILGDNLIFKFDLDYTTMDIFNNQLKFILNSYPLIGSIE